MTDPDAAELRTYAVQRVRDGLTDDPMTIRLDVAMAARACLAEFDRLTT